ncbi:ATP-dependent chaperone ClpB [Sesbania bispinosa]|nr:ATP-dependent chaperone ClpB [Sesbania bispinosa]
MNKDRKRVGKREISKPVHFRWVLHICLHLDLEHHRETSQLIKREKREMEGHHVLHADIREYNIHTYSLLSFCSYPCFFNLNK